MGFVTLYYFITSFDCEFSVYTSHVLVFVFFFLAIKLFGREYEKPLYVAMYKILFSYHSVF